MKSDIDHVILVLENQSLEGTSSGTAGRPNSKKLLAFFSDFDTAIGDKPRRDEGEDLSDNASIETYKRRPTLKDRIYFHSHTLPYILYYRGVLDPALETMTDLASRGRLSN
jgi:hypothetical protein